MGSVEFEVYHSFDEAPLDVEDGEADGLERFDHDDSDLALAPWANPAAPPTGDDATLAAKLEGISAVRLSAGAATATRLVVPHPRDLRRGMRGFDVLALQRAMAVAGERRWGSGFTGQFGRGLYDDVRDFQRKHTGLVVDGVYGASTHARAARYYDAYGIRLLNRVRVRTAAQVRQADLMAGAMVLYNRRSVVHYTQGPARMGIVRHRLSLAQLRTYPWFYEDCSSSVTGLYRVAGLADPNGFGFNGLGFTGTLAAHGAWYQVSSSLPKGALVLYGWSFPYHHVTMVVGPGRVWSHGSEAGPLLCATRYRSDASTARVYSGLPG